MNKLIIRAHPHHNTGYNFAICSAIQAAAQHAGHHVEMIDLYHEMPQSFLQFNGKPIPYKDEIQAKLTWADEYIFVFPIRGAESPAILKNFIDVNIGKGFGYDIMNGKVKKLLTHKTARIVATAGGPGFFYPLLWRFIRGKARLGFNGIRIRSIQICSYVMTISNAKRIAFIEQVAQKCSK